MLFLAIFPLLMIATVIFAALSSVSEHEARWESESTYACCPERAAAKAEHQLVA